MRLSVERLSFAYGGARARHEVLKDVTFAAEPGQLLSVLGPNGVGKSTLFRCILGLLPGYGGSIRLDEADARGLSAREIARRVAYIPQTHYPAFNYAVFDMVLMGTTHSMGAFSTPGEKQRRAAEAALGRMGISHLAGRSYMRLSGGEQQMVLIARALAQESPVLMMDEPTASLDYGNQHRVLSCVRSLAREDGYTVVLSTHNPQHALSYADAILALHDGRVLVAGTPQAVLSADLLRTLYGVDVCMVDTPQGRVVLPVDGPEEGVAP